MAVDIFFCFVRLTWLSVDVEIYHWLHTLKAQNYYSKTENSWYCVLQPTKIPYTYRAEKNHENLRYWRTLPPESVPPGTKKKKTETVWALRYKRQRPYLEHNKNRPSYFKHWSSLDEPPPTCYLSGILVLRKYQNLKKTVYVVPDILMDFPGKDQFWKPALQCVW